jgi:hypothetical protein
LLGDYVNRVITTNGIFKPTVVVNNRCVGTWKWTAESLTLDLFEELNAADLARVRDDVDRVTRYLTAS